MPSAITNSVRILNADALSTSIVSKPTFIYIAKSTQWADEELPPNVTGSSGESLQIANDLLAIKKIESNNIASVVPRVAWASGTVYDFYDHRVNVVDGRKPDGSKYKFYVLTDEFNVYKCISNANGVASTFKPNSQQLTPFQTPDGYVWKYMYTVRVSDVFSFLTPDWMPVYTLTTNDGSAQWNVQQTAIRGGIHEIVLVNKGDQYSATTPPTVSITGNGAGATAIANVNALTGKIDRIVVTNPGSGYTEASVSITTTSTGVGGTAAAILSPLKGHGADAKLELGGYHKMIKMTLDGTEAGKFPVGQFRQTGLLHKPLSNSLGSSMLVSSVGGLQVGQTITGTTSGATGDIVLIESEINKIWLNNVVGDYVQNETFVSGTDTKVIISVENDTNLIYNLPTGAPSDIIRLSGDILYISNRTAIARAEDQAEDVRMILTF